MFKRKTLFIGCGDGREIMPLAYESHCGHLFKSHNLAKFTAIEARKL